MTTAEARKVFDKVIAQQTDADKVAKLELAREYFTNMTFRKTLEEEVARINGVTA